MTDPTKQKSIRDEIRGAIFGKKVVPIQKTLMGIDIEILRPTLGDIADMRADEDDDQSIVIRSIIKYAVVPGTQERVFDEPDYDALRKLPFTKEIAEISNAMMGDLETEKKPE